MAPAAPVTAMRMGDVLMFNARDNAYWKTARKRNVHGHDRAALIGLKIFHPPRTSSRTRDCPGCLWLRKQKAAEKSAHMCWSEEELAMRMLRGKYGFFFLMVLAGAVPPCVMAAGNDAYTARSEV